MLRLSKLADYATVLLVQLGQHDTLMTATALAGATGVPEPPLPSCSRDWLLTVWLLPIAARVADTVLPKRSPRSRLRRSLPPLTVRLR